MADISDVEIGLVTAVAQTLQLGSRYIPGSRVVSPNTGVPVRVYRGWPVANELERDLAQGTANVSIFPVPHAATRIAKYMPRWQEGPAVPPALTATVADNSVIFSGDAKTGQIAGIRLGDGPVGRAWAYRTAAGDTPANVAAGLATQIPGASTLGTSVVLADPTGLDARVVADRRSWMETRRQQQHVWITGWFRTPEDRDVVMSAIDRGLSSRLTEDGSLTDFISLPDGTNARLQYVNSSTEDKPAPANLWRRDLRYLVEYATTLIQMQPCVLFIGGHLYVEPELEDPIAAYGDLPAT